MFQVGKMKMSTLCYSHELNLFLLFLQFILVIHSAVLHVARQTSVINLPENLPKEAMEAAIKDVSATNGGQSSSLTKSENGLHNSGHLR